jgi:hypothetical protein
MTGEHPIRVRRTTAADAAPLARGIIAGVEHYTSFAPPDWTAPALATELEHLRESLADERVYCLLAESNDELVGQITILPAARAPHPLNDRSRTSRTSSCVATTGEPGLPQRCTARPRRRSLLAGT